MTTEAKKVLKDFQNLTLADKNEIADLIKDFTGTSIQKSFSERKIAEFAQDLGPTNSSACPRCGRG